MIELVIFVGLQGAGKSSFYRHHYASTHAHVSKDLMRNNRNRERRQRHLVDEALAQGRSVVVDNTNPAPADRAPLLAIGSARGARLIGVFFDVPLRICMERNRRREGIARVPDVALRVTRSRLVPPTLEEGFDEIRRVHVDPQAGLEVERPGAD
ncbi:AAA family ATPase [Vulgatibacter sp.]|uniref:AAA family ATPase n=1 Tax=Vulgatibacter sp. TaxID=1971226 RepID=UPI003561FB93